MEDMSKTHQKDAMFQEKQANRTKDGLHLERSQNALQQEGAKGEGGVTCIRNICICNGRKTMQNLLSQQWAGEVVELDGEYSGVDRRWKRKTGDGMKVG